MKLGCFSLIKIVVALVMEIVKNWLVQFGHRPRHEQDQSLVVFINNLAGGCQVTNILV